MGDKPNQRGLSRKHIMDGDRRLAATARHRLRRPVPDSPLGRRARRSRRRWKRCTTWSRRARCATSARRACTPGSSPRRCTPADLHGWTRFVSMQNHYNLVYREEEREMIPLCIDRGRRRHPLEPAGARLPGGQPHAATRAARRRARKATASPTACTTPRTISTCGPRGRTCASSAASRPAQIALAWMLHKPGITAPIIGASKMPHLDEAHRRCRDQPVARRNRLAGGTLPAAPGARPLVARSAEKRNKFVNKCSPQEGQNPLQWGYVRLSFASLRFRP